MARKKIDHALLGAAFVIIIIGLVALLSASNSESQRNLEKVYGYFAHQIFWGIGLGLVAGFITYKIPYKKFRTFALPILLVSVFFLILVFIPSLSLEVSGARRWINVFGFSFQPSEFAKLSVIIYLAAWLEARHSNVKRFSAGLIPFLIIVGITGGLIILQPDIGTFAVLALISASLFFVSGAGILHMGMLGILGATLLFLLIKLEPYRMARLISLLDNSKDPFGISYQINQAMLAIGSGGLLGIGLGKSVQGGIFLPESMKDSIFAVWAQELGFLGVALLIAVFLFFAFKGFRIAKNAKDRFGKLLACGITCWIVIQAFINIGSMIGLLPLTGIPLPFVSYGGSSMVATMAGLGILLNISKHT
ncbi:MAG: putative lipid II flippase FtsW [Candidatus Spechtbacteria bacterium]|nr:putative lipid II flippase FtsW [Candidatus Spechtbacteria bacterium]